MYISSLVDKGILLLPAAFGNAGPGRKETLCWTMEGVHLHCQLTVQGRYLVTKGSFEKYECQRQYQYATSFFSSRHIDAKIFRYLGIANFCLGLKTNLN